MNILNLSAVFSIALIGLLCQALATPFIRDPAAAPDTHPVLLAARADNHNDTCDSDVATGLAGHYFVTLQDWGGGEDPRGCGRGLLDNLHGHCGDVDEWECDARDGGGAFATFYLSGPRYAHCLNDAVWAASPPDNRATGFCCTWNGGMGHGLCK